MEENRRGKDILEELGRKIIGIIGGSTLTLDIQVLTVTSQKGEILIT